MEGAKSIVQNSDGEYVFAGSAASDDFDLILNNGGFDYWIVKLSAYTAIQGFTLRDKYSVFPNPASDVTYFLSSDNLSGAITLIDVSGNVVYSSGYLPYQKITIDLASFPKGIYFIRLQNGKTWNVERLVIQ